MEERILFHLTGARSGGLGPVDGLRPALFARFGDLTKLRYDFPLVLLAPEGDGPFAVPLSGVVDELLGEVAPKGLAGERMRRNVLRLEREIRAMLASGEAGTLGALWARATDRIAPRRGEPFLEDAGRARSALRQDGQLVGCDGDVASRFVANVWRAVQERKSRSMRRTIDALALRLADLVRADRLRSQEGRRADALRAGVGTRHRDLFDFDLMAKLLSAPSGESALSPSRRERIERTVATLRAQRFFEADVPYVFAFDHVEDALAAYRERRGPMADLVRAMAVAELELRGAYVEEKHDGYFARFDHRALSDDDLALFPDYLVSLDGARADMAGRARIIEGLTSGAPLKIVFATDDAFGLGAQLAATAMGLGDAFVLQASAARLYRVRDRVRAAIGFRGAALISVFVPTPESAASLPPYLVAAAATESRAFPTFSYDPSAGTGWKERFALHDDPQPERTWPSHELAYADGGMQRVSEDVAFTLADLALCDPRRADGLARVGRERWDERLVPIASWLETATDGDVPFVYAVDERAGLHKVVVDEHLAELTRRSAQAWRRLRELDGLKRERADAAVPAAVPAPEAVAVAAVPVAAGAPAPAEVPAAPSSDEAYIETPRCTTCNECTGVNPRMFAYNENKQAYIKDLNAGSYRDLVEAAESCQVAIIHPGKPRDPNEPGLEDLLKRAEPFR
ncbi:MAG TPA: ferredoxin [Candidatus Limnocylindria bacterium]|nr:ferredoxin [Candidatus Limnocylindria bacterium]